MQAYDKDLDYSDLIAREAAKGVNADRALLAQYEAARNAKIAGEGLDLSLIHISGLASAEIGIMGPPSLPCAKGGGTAKP